MIHTNSIMNLVPLRLVEKEFQSQFFVPKNLSDARVADANVLAGVQAASFQMNAKDLAATQFVQQELIQAFSNLGISIEGTFLSVANLLIPSEGLFSAFQDAFYSYLSLDEGSFANAINFLGEYSGVQSSPNFLNLTFEQLFEVPVAEGGSDILAIMFSGESGAVESISVPLNLNSDGNTNDVTSVASEPQTLAVLSPIVFTTTSTTTPPPSTGTGATGAPTTPAQTIDNAESGALNFASSSTYSGNIFVSGPYNGNTIASFGPDGGTRITASFADAIPGSNVSRIPGATVLTLPDGNYLTFYTANVNGHKVGEYVYTLVAPHLLATTTATVFIDDNGQRYFIDTFQYTLTSIFGISRTGEIQVIIKDDKPVATDLINLTPSSEADIAGIGSNLLGDPNTLAGSLITSPVSSEPNYFGANGGTVTNVTIAGGSTVVGASQITVIDSYGNQLVIDRATGSYTYTLTNPVSHSNNQAVVNIYNYQFTDNNGNVANANLTITIQDDTPVALNLHAGAVSENNIETIGSNGLLFPNTIAGYIVAETPTTSTSRYGADGAATDGGITNAALVNVNGATEDGSTPITAITVAGTITQTDIDNSNGALNSSNLGNRSIIVTDSLGNTLVIDAITSQYVYTLNQAFHNDVPDTSASIVFSYQLTDGDGSTSSAQLTVTVNDDQPVAVDQSNSASETALFVNGTETADGNILTGATFGGDGFGELTGINGFTAVGGIITAETTYGTILVYTIAQSGFLVGDYIYTLDSVKTTPIDDSLLSVTDAITYQFIDGDGSVASANLNVAVELNQAPTAVADTNLVDQDGSLNINALAGLLSNDTDPNFGDQLDVLSINGSQANVGSSILLSSGALLTINEDGSYTYDTNGAFDHFTLGQQFIEQINYTMRDAEGLQSSSTLSITVNGSNVAPVANNDSYFNSSDIGAATFSKNAAEGLLANDTDLNIGDVLSISKINGQNVVFGSPISLDVAGQPNDALLTLQSDGSFTFNYNNSLPEDATRSVSFTYQVQDQFGALSNLATVDITVNNIQTS